MSKHELDEYDKRKIEIGVTSIPRGTEPAIERCAHMLRESMRTTSRTASKGYLGAAKWFAWAAQKEK